MRTPMLAALASLAAASTLQAAPLPAVSDVRVTIGPELRKKAVETYGVRDVERLAGQLQSRVSQELERSGGLGGAGRLELVLVDAKPNRPTFKQMSDRPGLSYGSFGLGGATIEGQAIGPDGTAAPVRYSWYESNIAQVLPSTTWRDAEWTIDRFAARLARGELDGR